MRAQTTIRTHLNLEDQKRFIRNHTIQMKEKTIMATKEKIIGTFSIMIQMFRLPHAGDGSRTILSLKNHIARHIKAEGSVAAKRYKEHSRIAEAK
ncbi:MAG: hypothetical protein EZS28_005676 [Streblomastix strix]|uniref:Uncharacterized protein n=1 Tax=Streblomastix strix TaxID=222440 RepID=A0A5J4WUS7_9EUKA|nr:MAG: hypothetical protein EZS28_005673 [Streblomastix strix]KAA6398800.1 MAG: hypothetical protein EZS28_005676 [Streblomastix strix]